MIAANYRKYADALIAQMELDLAGVVTPYAHQREAAWTWLMQAGIVQAVPKRLTPNWAAKAKRAAHALSMAIKAACMRLAFQHGFSVPDQVP